MYGSIAALIPFFVVVPIALWTKQVIPGLAVGLIIGAYMVCLASKKYTLWQPIYT